MCSEWGGRGARSVRGRGREYILFALTGGGAFGQGRGWLPEGPIRRLG